MPTPPLSEGSIASSTPEPTFIREDNLQALLNWASTDADIKKLIQREHIAGRIDQAINFANFMETFDENPEAKQLYRTKDNFYAVLRSKYTKKREDGGFSASSCKRLKVEGDCYISLQKAHHTKFPQSQNVAVALKGCTTQQNIVDIWNAALGIYDGDEKCILKRDIPVALDIYNRAQLAAPAAPAPDIALLQQRIQELETQIAAAAVAAPPAPDIVAPAAPAAPAPEIAILQQEAQDYKKRIRTLELQVRNAKDPIAALEKSQKKLAIAEKCLDDIKDRGCLAYYKETETNQITIVRDFDTLQSLFKENKSLSDQNQPTKYEIKVQHDEEDKDGIVCNDLAGWKYHLYRHFIRFLAKIDEIHEKKDQLFDDLDVESDSEEESGSESGSDSEDENEEE